LGAPFPVSSDAEIRAAIETYPAGRLGDIVRDSDPGKNGIPLAIKNVSAESARFYQKGLASKFNISTAVGYTWGAGTYVAPLAFPTSSAIFGRLGVVAQFDPAGWQVFDAVNVKNQDLYLSWTWRQASWHRLSMLRAGSAFYNQELRNRFRSRFKIDCVLFPPDQENKQYTKNTDVWMCVTDWETPKTIRAPKTIRMDDKGSNKFTVLKPCVLVDEEFYDTSGGTERRAYLNPGGRILTKDADVAQAIADSYFSGRNDWVRVEL
jgi:hypothetical protein